MTTASIGLVGIGLLGTALAERMLARGLCVQGFDLDAKRLAELKRLGGQPHHSPASVAAACQTIVLCLPDSSVVARVVDGLGDAIGHATLLIDATTGDPDQTMQLAASLRRRGIGYVDATIAGSSDQVRRGEAVVLIGGEASDVERAAPVLQSWSDRRFHLGPAGSGARMKLVVNLVLGLNRAVLAEGLALAEACGLNLAVVLNVLKATPAYSAAMDTKGPKMVARDYAPQARLSQHLKDVRLIGELARRASASVPLSEAHAQLLALAVEMGLGDADNSAVLEVYSRLAGEARPHPAAREDGPSS